MKKDLSLSNRVMKEIHERRITMRSRWYFIAGTIAFGTGLAAAALTAIAFFSILFFRIHAYGHFGYLWFGRLGLRALWGSFPWTTLIIAICGLSVGILLLRRLDAAYRRNYRAIAAGVTLATITAGILLGIFGLQHVSQFSCLDRYLHRRQAIGSHWIVGEIVTVNAQELELRTPSGELARVVWDDETMLPHGAQFVYGQRIRVVGTWENNTFKAQGIGKGGMHWRSERNGRMRRNMQ